MGGVSKRILLLLAMALLVVGAAGCGGDDDEEGGEAAQTGGTLVFAGAADPVVIDGALVSDGESIRVITQIFETLINLKPGTTELAPGLATEWEVSPDALTYTFALREGVKFHDGTDFNAEAVCFNFDRWYNFKGPLQSPSASYYYSAFFGGFKNNESEDLSDPLYKSCEARNPTTAVITLTRPSASLLGALVQQAFSIASPKALQEFKADAGTLDEETGFRPTGTFGTEHPIGTGPFEFVSWNREDRLVLKRYEDYWGEKAKLDELIIRPIADNAARLQALQNDEIQGYDLVEPQDIGTIEGSDNLKILDRPAFNVAYVGINQAKKPMDNLKVRQAVAHGLDRQAVVDSFYGGRGVVANQMMPPEVEGYADTVDGVPVRPGEGEAAPPGSRRADARGDRVLVPERRLPAVHAQPEEQLRGLRGQPEQVRLQGRPEDGPVGSGLPRPGRRGQRRPPAPDRVDGRLRRRGQLHRDVLPGLQPAVRLP